MGLFENQICGKGFGFLFSCFSIAFWSLGLSILSVVVLYVWNMSIYVIGDWFLRMCEKRKSKSVQFGSHLFYMFSHQLLGRQENVGNRKEFNFES